MDVQPGDHIVTLRKDNFVAKDLARSFMLAQRTRISGTDGQLTPFGTLEFKVSPPGANITYRFGAESQGIENGKTKDVRPGRYVITAVATGFEVQQKEVQVDPGKNTLVDFSLNPLPSAAPKAPTKQVQPTVTRDYFADPGSWSTESGWWVHKGGDSWLKSNQGVYLIQLQKPKGGFLKKARVEWVIDQKDANNQVTYSFDFSALERKVTVEGKTVSEKRKLPSPVSGDVYAVVIDINPDRIIIREPQGKVLDQYTRPNTSARLGKFGFKGDVELTLRKVE